MTDANTSTDPLQRMRLATWIAGADLEAVVARLPDLVAAYPLVLCVSRPPTMVGPFMTATPGRARPDVFVWRDGTRWAVRASWEGIPWFFVDGHKVVVDAASGRPIGDDEWVHTATDTGLPRDEATRAQAESAQFFMQALVQRAHSVEALTRLLVERAPEFFLRRTQPKPLVLASFAKDAGLPEATTRAVLRSMRLRCAFGDYKLSHFFRTKELEG